MRSTKNIAQNGIGNLPHDLEERLKYRGVHRHRHRPLRRWQARKHKQEQIGLRLRHRHRHQHQHRLLHLTNVPSGRAPKGKQWDSMIGQWIPDTSKSSQYERSNIYRVESQHGHSIISLNSSFIEYEFTINTPLR